MVNETSRSRRYLITKNSILMLVMLVVIFLAVWAWYASDISTAEVGGLSMRASNPGGVQIALPYKGSYPLDTDDADYRFKESIDFAQSEFFSTDLFSDVTSDGINFIIPTFEVDKDNKRDGRIVIPEGEWTKAVSSKEAKSDVNTDNDDKFDYVAIDFYLRSTSEQVKVDGSSFLAALSDINGYPLKVDSESQVGNGLQRSCGNLYGKGKFSADALVGAMRVSLVAQNVIGQTSSGSGESLARSDTYASGSSPALKFLWLPRPDICLYTGEQTNTSYDDWRLDIGITPNTSTYVNKTYRHSFYMFDDVNVNRKVSKHTYYDDYIANSINDADLKASYKASSTNNATTNPSVFHVSKGNGSKTPGYYPTLGNNSYMEFSGGTPVTFTDGEGNTADYYVYKMTLNIWIEGEDAEARRAMGSGLFKLKLVFG